MATYTGKGNGSINGSKGGMSPRSAKKRRLRIRLINRRNLRRRRRNLRRRKRRNGGMKGPNSRTGIGNGGTSYGTGSVAGNGKGPSGINPGRSIYGLGPAYSIGCGINIC